MPKTKTKPKKNPVTAKNPRGAGRIPKLVSDEKVKQRILNAVRLGMTFLEACRLAGISEGTWYAWAEKGKADPTSLYGEFLNQLEIAKLEGKLVLVGNIYSASRTDWRAAAHILAKRYSEEWGDRIQIDTDWKALARDAGIDPDGPVFHEIVKIIRDKIAGHSETTG